MRKETDVGFCSAREETDVGRTEWMKIERERKRAKTSLWSGRRLFVLCY
jgi:hypothetical protein